MPIHRLRHAHSNAPGFAPEVCSRMQRLREKARAVELLRASLVCFSFLFSFSFPFFDQVKNPAKRVIEDGGFERVRDEMSIFAGGDELGVFEQIAMIRNARGRHFGGAADLTDGELAFRKHFEAAAARAIALWFAV